MVVAYFACVVLYYLFGYLFLPDSICGTAGYILGAFAFPFVLLIIVGVILKKTGYEPPPTNISAFKKGYTGTNQRENRIELHKKPRYNFENRLRRARTEPMEIIEFCDEAHSTARIKSATSENVYFVTTTSCECMDYTKCGAPCKHMICLALKTGRYMQFETPRRGWYEAISEEDDEEDDDDFMPLYWNYYDGLPTGIGYVNLYPYHVVGRVIGVSEKTGRQTNRKKGMEVYATNKEDAVLAATEAGLVPPFTCVEYRDIPPTDGQYSYLHGTNIPYPNLITATDASALLTRYEEEDDRPCPSYLISMATACRVQVSYFQNPSSVKLRIWHGTPDNKKPALFCYAAYCNELGVDLGNTKLSCKDSVFSGFLPNAKQLKYILNYMEFGYRALSRNSSAYKDAALYLENKNIL